MKDAQTFIIIFKHRFARTNITIIGITFMNANIPFSVRFVEPYVDKSLTKSAFFHFSFFLFALLLPTDRLFILMALMLPTERFRSNKTPISTQRVWKDSQGTVK